MTADPRLRRRFLVLVLFGLLGWLAGTEKRARTEQLAVLREAGAASARRDAAARQEERQTERLSGVLQRLVRRNAPPESAAALRESLLAVAAEQRVQLSAVRLQPLIRAPSGTAGSEARITAIGDSAALTRFLAAVERRGWPLRLEDAQLAVRGGVGTLTATIAVLWPDRTTPFRSGDTARLAGDPRLEGLVAWLESADLDGDPETARERERIERSAMTDPPDEPPPAISAETSSSSPNTKPAADTPQLHGFVDLGAGVPVKAALFYRGETVLVGAGDRLGEYTVVKIEPLDFVLVSRHGDPPLRIALAPG